MTVAELIERLQEMPQDAVIVTAEGDGLWRSRHVAFVPSLALCVDTGDVITTNVNDLAVLGVVPFDSTRRVSGCEDL